jgi:hypothetical protein
MNIFRAIRERIGAAIGAVIGAIFLLGCGALLVLFLSPKQAIEANRIEKMPEMGTREVEAAPSGDDVLVTGRLEDNPLMDAGGFVAYEMEEWTVTLPDPDDPEDEPEGDWETVEQLVPNLSLNVNGKILRILGSDDATLSGLLNEEIIYSEGYEEAEYDGEWVPHGSLRLRGFFNGDLVTVLGKKASAGGIIPEELYGGDRVAFADSKHRAARGLLIGGIVMMACSPVVLVGGLLSALFGRRRRR